MRPGCEHRKRRRKIAGAQSIRRSMTGTWLTMEQSPISWTTGMAPSPIGRPAKPEHRLSTPRSRFRHGLNSRRSGRPLSCSSTAMPKTHSTTRPTPKRMPATTSRRPATSRPSIQPGMRIKPPSHLRRAIASARKNVTQTDGLLRSRRQLGVAQPSQSAPLKRLGGESGNVCRLLTQVEHALEFSSELHVPFGQHKTCRRQRNILPHLLWVAGCDTEFPPRPPPTFLKEPTTCVLRAFMFGL